MANKQNDHATPTRPDPQVPDQLNTAKLLTAKNLGTWLSLSKRQIARLNASGRLPRPIRIGGAVRWEIGTITLWIAMGCPSRQEFDAMKEQEVPHAFG